MEQAASPMQDDEIHAQHGRSRKKRRRTVQACEECRDRKRKCDGKRPVCGSCSRRPGRCIWNDHRNTKGWSNHYVESLQCRIRELESSQGLPPSSPGADQQELMQHSNLSPLEGHAMGDIHADGDSGVNMGSAPDVNTTGHQRHTSRTTHPIDSSTQLRGATPDQNPIQTASAAVNINPPLPETTESQGRETTRPQVSHNSQLPMSFSQSMGSPFDDISADDVSADDDFDAAGSDSFVDGLDAMGVVHSASDSAIGRPRRPSGYFGPSSTVSLLGDAFSAIKQRIYKNGPPSAGSRDSGAADLHDDVFQQLGSRGHQNSVPQVRNDTRAEASLRGLGYTIPTRAEADKLVDSYKTWVHSLYPFTHMPSFLARYRSIWESTNETRQNSAGNGQIRNPTDYYDGASEKLFHCMLNAVFALGALFNPVIAPESRDAVSRTFFTRAKALVDLDELACGSTTLVQVLLLMGQYLQSTDAASSCWNIVGLAIRVCQGIGLHREPDCCQGSYCTRDDHSQLDREMRRRSWSCSIILDRVLSLTYGRPMMIHPAMTRYRLCLPLAIDDEHLTGPGQPPGKQPAGTISLLGCFIESVRLQEIIGKFIFPVNHVPFESRQDTEAQEGKSDLWYEDQELDMKMMLDIENLFDDWRRNLAIHLQIRTYKADNGAKLNQSHQRLMLLERQANVLSSRFLHARLTLFRPALTVLCKAPAQSNNHLGDDSRISSIQEDMVIRAANLCLSATDALVDLMIANMDQSAYRLPAPWYNVFYVHSCAIVLLLGYLCAPSYITCLNQTSLKEAYERCVTFLRSYGPTSRSARRCCKVLTVIQHQVFHQNSSVTENNGQRPRVSTTFNGHSDILPNDPIDFQPLMPLCDPAQPQDMFQPNFSSGESLNENNLGWTGDTNDMAWLSLVPFWGDPQDNITT